MKILWCTHSLAGFEAEKGGYNGCGWITSLLNELRNYRDVEIAITFYYHATLEPTKRDGVTFYPIAQGHIGYIDKLKSFCGSTEGWRSEEKKHMSRLKHVVDSFQPDVIHVWGTETDMGLISEQVSVPVVLHLQGLLSPISNSLFPPGVSKDIYITQKGTKPWKKLLLKNSLNYWEYKAEREERIFKGCKHYFGRTHFDKAVSSFYSPHSDYFVCNEMMREEFYGGERWSNPNKDEFVIISTLSNPLYKGIDMALKVAKLLKQNTSLKFKWLLVGVSEISFVEKITGIKANDIGVVCVGIKKADELKSLLLSANLYMHPAYIDNSPNSVCEAQMLGVPVISTNIGGVSTIIDNGKTGWLVPSNEPHVTASIINNIATGKIDCDSVSKNEVEVAHARHNKQEIINSLIGGYNELINKCKK